MNFFKIRTIVTPIVFVLALSQMIFSGCANHLRIETLKEMEIERTTLNTTYFLSVDDEIVQKSVIHISGEKEDEIQVTQYESQVDKSIYTPYEGYRELWEFPLGVIMFPVAFVVNIVDFATLGLLPNRLTDNALDYSFAGINPFLNVENEKRTESKEINNSRRLIDQHSETRKSVAGSTILLVTSGELIDEKIALNPKGKAKISLFEDPYSENIESLSTMDISLGEESEGGASLNVLLTKDLRSRLGKARNIIRELGTDATATNLEKVVETLEDLQFPRAALELERTVKTTIQDEEKIDEPLEKAPAELSTIEATTQDEEKVD